MDDDICSLTPLTLEEIRKILSDHLDGAAESPIALLETEINQLREIQNPPLKLLDQIWALENNLAELYQNWETTAHLYCSASDLAGLQAIDLLAWLDKRTYAWLDGRELADISTVETALGEYASDGSAITEVTLWGGIATVQMERNKINIWLPRWWVSVSGAENVIDLHERLRKIV